VSHNNVPLAERILQAGSATPRDVLLTRCAQLGLEEMLELLLTRGTWQAQQARSDPSLAEAYPRFPPQPPWEAILNRALLAGIESSLPREQKLRIVRRLLEHGAPPNLDKPPMSALDTAVRLGEADIADLLCEFGVPYTAREAVVFNRIEEVKRLVAEDPAILHRRFPSYYGSELDPTLLGIALRNGHRELATFLIDAGAPLDGPEWWQGTLLHSAAHGGHPELIRTLAERGLDLNAQDETDSAPLHYAISEGNVEAVAELIALGADVNVARSNGWTPLHSALWNNAPPIAKMLLDSGADLTRTDREGRTPIEFADVYARSWFPKLLEEMSISQAESITSPLAE
jgi:ankyrin repeat protein